MLKTPFRKEIIFKYPRERLGQKVLIYENRRSMRIECTTWIVFTYPTIIFYNSNFYEDSMTYLWQDFLNQQKLWNYSAATTNTLKWGDKYISIYRTTISVIKFGQHDTQPIECLILYQSPFDPVRVS